MLNPMSPGVMATAAIVASPALYSAFEGTMPVDIALTRYLITVLVAWALLSIAKSYVVAARHETRRALQEIAEAEAKAKAAAEGTSVQATVTSSSNVPTAGPDQPAAPHHTAGAA